MNRAHYRTVVVIIVAITVAACAPLPASIEAPISALPTAGATDLAPTVAAPALLPTPTEVPAAAAEPPPAMAAEATAETDTDHQPDEPHAKGANSLNITIGDTVLTATLVDNSSVAALKEALAEGPLTIDMSDYGRMEKVGPLGMSLPRNDEQITTEAGDIILYQGDAFVIYYAVNAWNFTRLGKVDDVSAEELREILGEGDVTVTLSLP